VRIRSLGHWLYASVAPDAIWGKARADFEMNLTYANAWLFPIIFTVAWLPPIWSPSVFYVSRSVRGNELTAFTATGGHSTQQTKLGLENLVLTLTLMLISVLVGFYAYFTTPLGLSEKGMSGFMECSLQNACLIPREALPALLRMLFRKLQRIVQAGDDSYGSCLPW